jgi:hypothetical protein
MISFFAVSRAAAPIWRKGAPARKNATLAAQFILEGKQYGECCLNATQYESNSFT